MPGTWWLAALAVLAAAVYGLRWAERAGHHARAAQVAVFAAALTLVPTATEHRRVLELLGASLLLIAALALLVRRLRRGRIELRGIRRARVAVLRAPAWQFGVGLFAVTFVLCSLLSWALFAGLPVIQDSQAQLFHAEIFASGRLVADAPPAAIAEFFEADHIIVRGGFYSQYPPGHTIVLVLGVLAGAPWAVNPALGGIALVLIWLAGRAMWNERTGRRAALLGLASPFVIFMSSEHMNHATALALFALQVLATVRTLRAGSLRWALIAGLAVGWQVLVRPITAVGLAAPLGVLVLAYALRAPRRFGAPAAVMAAAALALGSTLLWFNDATNGDPWLMGYVVRWGPEHTIGFGIAPWGSPHHPAQGLEHTLDNLLAWNVFLFGGPLPALLFVALGVARDRTRPMMLALACAPALVLSIYFFYFFQDLTFGPRYLYEASVFALLAASRGIGWLPRLLPRVGLVSTRVISRGFVGWMLGLGGAIALATLIPPIVWEYAFGYALHGGVVDRAEAEIPEGRALVFVDGAYQRAFYAVDPELSSRILFARDLGDARNAELVCAMPDREPWVDRDFTLSRAPRVVCGD